LTIEERLLSVRKHVGLTQAAFAKKFGLSSRAYASYELGERELPSSLAIMLHDELSISPTWLLTGEGAQSSNDQDRVMQDAIVAVRTFAMSKGLEIDPEREAKLVILLVEYFLKGGTKDSDFVQNMLETAA